MESHPAPLLLRPVMAEFQSLADQFPAQQNREFLTCCREDSPINREIITRGCRLKRSDTTPGVKSPAVVSAEFLWRSVGRDAAALGGKVSP